MGSLEGVSSTQILLKEKESKNAAGTAVGAKEMSPILYGSFKKEW